MESTKQGKKYTLRLTEEEVTAVGRVRSRYSKHNGRIIKLCILALAVGYITSVYIEAAMLVRFIVLAAPFMVWFVYLSYIVMKRNKEALLFLQNVKQNHGEGNEEG